MVSNKKWGIVHTKEKKKELTDMEKESIRKEVVDTGNKDNSGKKTNKKRTCNKKEMEIRVLYVICAVLLGLVIGLSIKIYRLENKISDMNDASPENIASDSDATGVPADDTEAEVQVSTAVMGSEQGVASSQLSEAQLIVLPGVEYTDVDIAGGEEEYFNGDDLSDNGCPYAIKINRQENIVTIYTLDDKGYYTVPVKAMRCSVSPVGETPEGLFNIQMKWEWLALFDNCYGQYVSQIEGDTLFHSVPYIDTTKDSLETWEFNKLGTGASLGCVRLCVADTKWIYDNCEQGTYVNIFDSDYYGPLGRPVPVTKLENTEDPGWDPTDMTEENPLTGKAVIYGAESHSIKVGENYDPMAGIWAFDSERQDVTEQITVEGSVDNSKAGKYNIKYSFLDQGREVSKQIAITVVDEKAPEVEKVPVKLHIESYHGQREQLAALVASYVTAKDGGETIKTGIALSKGKTTDGKMPEQIKDNVVFVAVDNMKEAAGTYQVSCYAQDAEGNKSSVFHVDITVGR